MKHHHSLLVELERDDQALLGKLTLESIPAEYRHLSPLAPSAPVVPIVEARPRITSNRRPARAPARRVS